MAQAQDVVPPAISPFGGVRGVPSSCGRGGGSRAAARARTDHGRPSPLRDSDPQEHYCSWGPINVFDLVGPYGKYLLGPDNIPGGGSESRAQPRTEGVDAGVDSAEGAVSHSAVPPYCATKSRSV